jgi:hypothetical protein
VLEDAQVETQHSIEKVANLKSAFNADRKMLQNKINDLEKKLTFQIRESQSLEQKIHMLTQAEGS